MQNLPVLHGGRKSPDDITGGACGAYTRGLWHKTEAPQV